MKMFQGSIEIYCIKTWIYSGKIKIHIIKKNKKRVTKSCVFNLTFLHVPGPEQ